MSVSVTLRTLFNKKNVYDEMLRNVFFVPFSPPIYPLVIITVIIMSLTDRIEYSISSDTPLSTSNMLVESTLVFYINGTRVEIDNPDPNITLLEYLRHIGLRGTKLACGEGACGQYPILICRNAR
jgi:hypothetical protein